MVSAPMVVVVGAFLVMLSVSVSVARAARGGELSAAVTVLCWYECTDLYGECVGITSPPQGDWYCGDCSLLQKKTKTSVNFKSVKITLLRQVMFMIKRTVCS